MTVTAPVDQAAPAFAAAQYAEQTVITEAAVRAAIALWTHLDPLDVIGSWTSLQLNAALLLSLARYQEMAAASADNYTDAILAELAIRSDPLGLVQPGALAGIASDGRDLGSLLDQPIITTTVARSRGMSAEQALNVGLSQMVRIVGTQVQDASRVASSISVATRPRVGWVRLVNPGACARCIILAGRFYRWSDGFKRHPLCGCVNIPASENTSSDIRTDPDAYFRSLSKEEQDAALTKPGAQAIRDGANISQVVNSRRGMGLGTAGLPTTTTGAKGTRPRLMPEAIYKLARDREDAVRLLSHYGFII